MCGVIKGDDFLLGQVAFGNFFDFAVHQADKFTVQGVGEGASRGGGGEQSQGGGETEEWNELPGFRLASLTEAGQGQF
jgi:hypothetical protein